MQNMLSFHFRWLFITFMGSSAVHSILRALYVMSCVPTFEPGAEGCETRMLPLSYAARKVRLSSFRNLRFDFLNFDFPPCLIIRNRFCFDLL